MRRTILSVFALLAICAGDIAAQQGNYTVIPARLSGPRVGVTVVTGESADRLREEVGIAPVFTQFGWQFERILTTQESGLSAMTEWVVLVGGLEQGAFLPSFSWLVGLRTGGGSEFGVGPNLSLAGLGLAVASGTTFRLGEINVPVNLAIVPSAGGVRFSMLSGFNMQRW